MSRYISAGIDIGSQTIRVAIAETKDNKADFSVIGMGEAPSAGVRQGYIVNQDEAVLALKVAISIAEKKAGVKIKEALISIGGIGLGSDTASGAVIISRVDGIVTQSDVEKAIELSEKAAGLTNRKIIHRFPLSYKINGKEVFGNPEGMTGMKLEVKVLFVTSLNQHLDSIIDTVEHAGVDVEDVVASPLAASVVILNKKQRTAGCVLANIGAETVSVGIFENDLLVSLRVFSIGSTDITNDIALGLQISLEEAEERKIGTRSTDSQKKLDEIIEARLRDIFDLIEAHLKKEKRNQLLPAGIIITGGGSGVPLVEEVAKKTLKLPARIIYPKALNNPNEVSEDSTWSVAYGLCLLGMNSTYHSDLFDLGGSSIWSNVKRLLSWSKQFLP